MVLLPYFFKSYGKLDVGVLIHEKVIDVRKSQDCGVYSATLTQCRISQKTYTQLDAIE